VEQLTSGLKTSHQLNAVLAACLEAGMMIVRLGEDPKNVKEWLSYYIKDVIKLLPPPPKKRWWNLFAG
jgi:hypothetical protein